MVESELAWGPTWATSLKSLWVGEGESIGDISVGDELAEHLGTEPIHPVLLDLCTGIVFPAFPAIPRGTGHERSAAAVAVQAGGPAGEDSSAILLPRWWHASGSGQRNASLRYRFRRSGWAPTGRN